MKTALKKIGIALVLLLLVAAAVGYFIQQQRDARTLAANPPPGDFVDVGGHELHYRLFGEGPVTFVLEAGGGEYSATWSEVETELARLGHVFVYDRAGMGWSEEGPHPRTIQQIVDELHAVLAAANVAGPHLMVGHSLGGLIVTFYAMEYPEDVAGLLLIDPSHKDQMRKMPQPPAWQLTLVTQLTRMAPIGLPQLILFGESSNSMKARSKHVRTFGAELRGVIHSVEQWAEQEIDLGDTPIYVLTNGEPTRGPMATEEQNRDSWEIWRRLHASLLEASTSDVERHVIVEGAGHYIHHDRPGAVVEAAEELARRISADPEYADSGASASPARLASSRAP